MHRLTHYIAYVRLPTIDEEFPPGILYRPRNETKNTIEITAVRESTSKLDSCMENLKRTGGKKL